MFTLTHTHAADITSGIQVFLYELSDARTYHLNTTIFHPQLQNTPVCPRSCFHLPKVQERFKNKEERGAQLLIYK